MDSRSKKEFFQTISELSLNDKIEKVWNTFAKPEDRPEALKLIYTFILRDKKVPLLERQELLKKFFPNLSEDEMKSFVEESRKKPKNLKNQLHLWDYLNKNKGSDYHSEKEKNVHILGLIASFLTHKIKGEEFVDKKDCSLIETALLVNEYPAYADQFKRIIHLAFRFQKQRIKRVGACFLHGVISQYQSIDIDILLNLLEEFYLSDEAYDVLSNHFDIICADKYPAQKVVEKLKIIEEADTKATLEEKERLLALIQRFDDKISSMS